MPLPAALSCLTGARASTRRPKLSRDTAAAGMCVRDGAGTVTGDGADPSVGNDAGLDPSNDDGRVTGGILGVNVGRGADAGGTCVASGGGGSAVTAVGGLKSPLTSVSAASAATASGGSINTGGASTTAAAAAAGSEAPPTDRPQMPACCRNSSHWSLPVRIRPMTTSTPA